VELKPGGHHLMLMGVDKPIVAGQKVPITLTIEEAGGRRTSVVVEAGVRALGK
jgi:copper(I)-binding protein